MLKRMTAALISLMLLLSTAAASGETLYVRSGSDEGTQAFLADHPEVTVETAKVNTIGMSTSELNSRLLTGEINCDSFHVYTRYQDVKNIISKGFLMDLSSNEIITEAVNRMWPSIRDQVMVDGKIYGVPSDAYIDVFICHKKEFQEAGYSQADVPHSFAGMLDFLEKWIIRNEQEPQSFQIINMWDYELYDKYSYTQWLVEKLMEQYIMQTQYAGKPLRFDDPELAELLERCTAIGAKLAEIENFSEPKYPALFEDAQARFYWGDVDAWSAITSVHDDQPRLLKANLTMDVVNAGTQNPELALDYLEACVQHPWADGYTARYLYTDVEPIKNADYEDELLWMSALVGMATDQLNGGLKDIDNYVDMNLLSEARQSDLRFYYNGMEELSTADLRDNLEHWQHHLDEMPSREYELSPEQIADYAKFAPTLFFPAPNVFNGSEEGRSTLYDLERRFATGQINAQQLCGELNRIAEMMEMEAQ